MTRSPVALLAFNRPAVTQRVFQAIRKARPSRLLLVADGPRPHLAGEAERCREVRALLKVDWPCKVTRDFSEQNLGCRQRISSGLDGIFRQVPEAIILEDDCLPHPSFFRYASEMLRRYQADERVMLVGGCNFGSQAAAPRQVGFTRYPHIWGWASWRRAWKHYDVEARAWPGFLASGALARIFPGQPNAWRYWEDRFEAVFRGQVNTWDYQWVLAIWRRQGLSVLPGVNLITNIGAGDGATHTSEGNPWMFRPSEALRFPLQVPAEPLADGVFDAGIEAALYSGTDRWAPRSWLRFLRRRVLRP